MPTVTIDLSNDEARGLSVLAGVIGANKRAEAVRSWLETGRPWPKDIPGTAGIVTPKIAEAAALAAIVRAVDKLHAALAKAGVDTSMLNR